MCEGGLALCKVCGGAEASLPTDCPGYLMRDVVSTGVQFGELDYLWRRGWVQESTWDQPRRQRSHPTGRRPRPAQLYTGRWPRRRSTDGEREA